MTASMAQRLKPKRVGNGVFTLIVTMAYEMDRAEKISKGFTSTLDAVVARVRPVLNYTYRLRSLTGPTSDSVTYLSDPFVGDSETYIHRIRTEYRRQLVEGRVRELGSLVITLCRLKWFYHKAPDVIPTKTHTVMGFNNPNTFAVKLREYADVYAGEGQYRLLQR